MTSGLFVGMDLLRLTPHEVVDRLHEEADGNPLFLVEDPVAWPDGWEETRSSMPITLDWHLRRQIEAMDLSDEVEALACRLAETLDERGFLTPSRAEIAVESRSPLVLVEAAVRALTLCDPAGVGACCEEQSISIQLERRGMTPTRALRVAETYPILMDKDLARAQSALGGTLEEVRALAEDVATLDLEPGRAFTSVEGIASVPDLRINRRTNGALIVEALDSWVPAMSVDQILRLQGQDHAPSRAFVESKVRSAEDLMRGIEFRRQTMLRLGNYLALAQADYFSGRAHLPKPLTRSEVALELNLHASTVGRALRGGALEFRGQVIRLDWFFPRRIEADGIDVNRDTVRGMLRQLVTDEPSHAPYSDTDLAAKLNEAGVDIARRTVAKYRDTMNIPPSHIRRRQALGPGSGVV